MHKISILQDLKHNAYPGRGIMIGKSEDGLFAVVVYFIMGRSENSRNRVFVTEGEGIKTQAFDSAKLTDPSLVIYAPVRVMGEHTIVTNGDQTDTICDFMGTGKWFEEALRSRTFEPDSPNFTPRISGLVTVYGGEMDAKLSILKSARGDERSVERFFYEYDQLLPGEGRFIHTYAGDGNPLPSFDGEPKHVGVEGDIETLSQQIWDALDSENKVSLFVRFIDLQSGKTQTVIQNKHE